MNRRQTLSLLATLTAGTFAGCLGDDSVDQDESDDDEEEEEPEPEEVSVELPQNSSLLFARGELSDRKIVDGERQDRNFPAGSFTEDQVGTPVSEFDLANADTSNVETMRSMFQDAESFNQDIGGWNTSNVENISSMFASAESFNQDIGGWDTSNVEDMRSVFSNAESFNQDISMWCVEDISDKPSNFDNDAGFEGDDAKQPNWGEQC